MVSHILLWLQGCASATFCGCAEAPGFEGQLCDSGWADQQPDVMLSVKPSQQACFGCSALTQPGRAQAIRVFWHASAGCSCCDALFEQPGPVFDHSHRNKVFLMFKWKFLYLHLFPLPPVLSLGISKMSLALCLLCPIRYLHIFVRSRWSLLFSRINNLSSLSLSS